MAQIIFNDRIDMVAVAATPSSDGYTVGYDVDGVIKQKDSAGVVTPLFSSSAQNLMQTLNLGNDSGIYSIMMGTSTSIYSSNSTGRIKLDHNGSVFIYSTASSTGTSSVHLSNSDINLYNSQQGHFGTLNITGKTFSVEVGSATGSVKILQNNNNFWISHNNTQALTTPNIDVLKIGSSYDGDNIDNKVYVHINSKDAHTNNGVKNSVVIGGVNITALSSNTVYLGNNVNVNNEYTFPNVDGSANQYLRTDGSGLVTWQDVTSTTAPLSDVLAVGNNSETYNIVMGTGTSIKSANGDSAVFLDSETDSGKILISSDGSIKAKSYIEIDNSTLTISATSGTITTGDLKGLQYSANYTATFVNNSLVTKQYVDSQLGNVFTTYKTAYVDPSQGSDLTGLINRPDKPYSSIAKAISGLTSSYAFTSSDTGMVYLRKGLYNDIFYLYSYINVYCEPGVVFSQNGFSDINGAVNCSVFGYARFLGTNENLVPLDVTKSSNINFEFFRIENQSVAFKVSNTTGTSNVNIKGDFISCKSSSGRSILVGSSNGDDVSSNVRINVTEKIVGAYNTISVAPQFNGTLEVNTPAVECNSDLNAGATSDLQHALSLRSGSASVVIRADINEVSTSNGGGINSAVYVNGGTVSIHGDVNGGECPGVYLANGSKGNISINGDIISKKESIINNSNNINFKVSNSVIKTDGLGTNNCAINVNTGSMSSTYLYNTQIYNKFVDSNVILMSSTSSRFGVYNSVGYSNGTSGKFIYCTGTVSVGMHNTRSNKDNSNDVEDTFTPSGFIYDQNLYLGDF